MYYYLVQSVKRRLIHELQDSFSHHPVYNKIVSNIQNRNTFTERPQEGIVVKGSSANKVSLAADNFMGVIRSHVMLAYVGAPTFPLEWVREDLACINANGGRIPTPPGVYYIEILSVPTNANDVGTYAIDPLISVNDEAVLRMTSGTENEAQLQQLPVPGTLRLWENRRFLLTEGTHYTVDYQTGAISLLTRNSPNSILTADYRYEIPTVGPIEFRWNQADFKTLSGVVLAFGKRAQKGDKIAVVVYEDRVDTANAYGGRFELSFELDVLARDSHTIEELADLAVMYLWSQKRDNLSSEGLEITDVSIGGEAEEIADETGDDYYYTANLSVQLQTDWEVHVPLPFTYSRVTATTREADEASSPLDITRDSTLIGNVQNKLLFGTFPVLVGKNNSFERIL